MFILALKETFLKLSKTQIKTLPKALRTQALTALTSNFGLVGLVQYAVGYVSFGLVGLVWQVWLGTFGLVCLVL